VIDAADTGDALRRLRARGIVSLLVEGGAGLAGSLLEADVVDRLIIIQAPLLLGGGALGAFSRLPGFPVARAPRPRLLGRRELGPDVMSTYAMR
jgi:diaminohydroxyphosphoribosylaminopyrimidine deaminase / 5-amino-6-(5-phosphoribosylamino)uracil reductase